MPPTALSASQEPASSPACDAVPAFGALTAEGKLITAAVRSRARVRFTQALQSSFQLSVKLKAVHLKSASQPGFALVYAYMPEQVAVKWLNTSALAPHKPASNSPEGAQVCRRAHTETQKHKPLHVHSWLLPRAFISCRSAAKLSPWLGTPTQINQQAMLSCIGPDYTSMQSACRCCRGLDWWMASCSTRSQATASTYHATPSMPSSQPLIPRCELSMSMPLAPAVMLLAGAASAMVGS